MSEADKDIEDHAILTSADSDRLSLCSSSHLQTSELQSSSSSLQEGLSKNKLRKLRNHEKRLSLRSIKRHKERDTRKQKGIKKSLGNEEKLIISNKLRNGLNGSHRVVVDCGYEKQMTYKEQTRLAQQLRRAYSSNKASDSPLHFILSSLVEGSDFFNICCKQNDGFPKYIIDRQEDSVGQLFSVEEIVYLSPDSLNVLSEFDPKKVYVIGGLVDETTHKNISLEFTKSKNLFSARLPIDEYFVPENGSGSGTFKKVLTVNQVFDIILKWYQTKDWIQAILAGLPERTGFIPREKRDDYKQ